jgi:predicted ArsR family transcriptional regulator
MSSTGLENQMRPAADRFLVLLKMRGPKTAAELGRATCVTGEAARQQLARLAEAGLVEATARPCGVGRPAQLWSLTEAGHARFPDAHGEVTACLIQSIRTEFGDAALQRLINTRATASKAAYADTIAGAADLGERVRRLAKARTREGYMAESRADGDGYVLIENHCPICVAATACQGFCQAELDTFRAVLGPDAAVERTEHIVNGDRRCVYRVSPGRVAMKKSKPRKRLRRSK